MEHQRLFSTRSDLESRLVYLRHPQGCQTCGGTGCVLHNSRAAHRHTVLLLPRLILTNYEVGGMITTRPTLCMRKLTLKELNNFPKSSS